jgi:hypothetical protein
LLTCCWTAPAGHRRVAGPDDDLNTARLYFILSWQPRHESFAAPKLKGVTADKARLLILLA